jgi:hypothetical protein
MSTDEARHAARNHDTADNPSVPTNSDTTDRAGASSEMLDLLKRIVGAEFDVLPSYPWPTEQEIRDVIKRAEDQQ